MLGERITRGKSRKEFKRRDTEYIEKSKRLLGRTILFTRLQWELFGTNTLTRIPATPYKIALVRPIISHPRRATTTEALSRPREMTDVGHNQRNNLELRW
jgi:hypothetical protein